MTAVTPAACPSCLETDHIQGSQNSVSVSPTVNASRPLAECPTAYPVTVSRFKPALRAAQSVQP